MPRLPLTFASAPYDRTLPLYDGRVKVEGIDLNVLLLRYEDTFWRMLRHQEFDVSEMSLSSYFISKEKGPDFVALPVFLSRVFRHSSIYINRNAGIDPGQRFEGQARRCARISDYGGALDPGHPRARIWRPARRHDLAVRRAG